MACCDLLDSCSFFNEQETDMPHTTEHLKKLYCQRACFTECALYQVSKVHGTDNVPAHLYPNDMFEISYLTEGQTKAPKLTNSGGTL